MTDAELKRYNRHLILPEIGPEGQVKLGLAKVLVIGAGGLGCPVLQYLTAAGVGQIGIVDHDTVDESNLQRQVLYSTDDVGRHKADAAKQKLARQNPFVNVITYITYLSLENAVSIISAYDIIIDGSDNFPTRYLVNDTCVLLNKPFLSGSVFKFEGQLAVFNYQDGPTYRCLYPEPPAMGEVPNCSETGVLGVLPGIIGSLQANEAIKIITGIGETLSGKLLVFDSLTMNFNFFEIALDPKNKNVKLLSDYGNTCESVIEISAEEFKKRLNSKTLFQLIDVRERHEYELKNIGGELIPLHELLNNLGRIKTDVPVIIHCQSGKRSKKAVELLIERGYKNVVSLKKGIIDF